MKDGKPEVLNVYAAGVPEGAMYVGRYYRSPEGIIYRSEFKNPINLGDGHNILVSEARRDFCIEIYQRDLVSKLRSNPLLLECLRGRDLVCHCAPLHCHADVLLYYANRDLSISIEGIPAVIPEKVA